ncbi:HET domain-containing protein [Fusarium sp. Ph1]|nr:HET domain-containing protein [Fusarium sp. Ph1]
MATVYSMSKVTIIAASSTSCHSGFLDVERHHGRLRASLGLPFQLTVSSVCTSGFHKHKSVGHPHDPLDTRAWTFQEEVLSSRYIKFTKDDIQWKCNAGSACICDQQPSQAYRGLWQVSSPTSLDERSWESLVEEFSHRLFTKDTDKLVSLSSLARKMASRFPTLDGQTPYVAGLWRRTLVQQLKWYTAGELGRHSDRYVAPSFSWASLSFYRRGVEFSLPLTHVLFEAVDASTTPVYQGNQFGAVSRRIITLYGPHIYYTMRFQERKPKMFIRQEITPALEMKHIILDCPLRERLVDDGRVTLQRSTDPTQQEDGEFSVSVFILGQSGQRPFGSLYCLILGYGVIGEHQRLGQVLLGCADRESKFSAEHFKPLGKEVVLV